MQTSEVIKTAVKNTYDAIARRSAENGQGCDCGCSSKTGTKFSEDYSKLSGYTPDADLGLGCGLPTEFAKIEKGDTVLDLGSGAGNDCFVARALVGTAGKVIGIDMTESMLAKAKSNATKLEYGNVEFRLGDIENLPVEKNSVDVVVSNCVMNLVPDKQRAFNETFRVLRPGGHFSISDIVLRGTLPDGLRDAAAMYAGCVAGALQKQAYLQIIEKAGFQSIQIQKERELVLPDELLAKHLSSKEIDLFRQSEVGIFSITVSADKPNESAISCP